MKDLIIAATSGLFAEVGKIIEHMKAQQARIADLERQLAEASAPAVVQNSYEHQRAVLEGERNAAADDYFGARELLDLVQNRRIFDAGFDRGFTARPAAPQAADTDKVREALSELVQWLEVGDAEASFLDKARAALASTMAAQAPVREVPDDLQIVPKISTSKMDRAGEAVIEGENHCDCGNYPMPNLEKVFSAMLAAAPLPAAPVQQEG